MANAPLRPPNQNAGGRPPRGHRRVATRRRTDLRTQLTAAADRLRSADAPELAEAVDLVLAPGGWTRLRDTDIAAEAGTSPNMTLLIGIADKELVVARAKEAGNTLTHDVNEAFVRFLAGEFTPRPAVRARPGMGDEKTTLNVRPSNTLRQEVEGHGVKAIHVATDYLLHKYQAGPYTPGAEGEPQPRGAVRKLHLPREIRDQIRAAQEKAGRVVTDDVEEALTAYLDGSFAPEAPKWTPEQNADVVFVKVNPNDDLFNRAAGAGSLRPTQVAIAYLMHKYGIRPGA